MGRRKLERTTKEWRCTLRERLRWMRMIFPPRRQLNESRIKYIGMDVHKEATVIAVPNGSGKLVMESSVETTASSILQFIHGLRGELPVFWRGANYASCFQKIVSDVWGDVFSGPGGSGEGRVDYSVVHPQGVFLALGA